MTDDPSIERMMLCRISYKLSNGLADKSMHAWANTSGTLMSGRAATRRRLHLPLETFQGS